MSIVSTQHQRVIDRQTDRQTDKGKDTPHVAKSCSSIAERDNNEPERIQKGVATTED